jgi:asparagine synthetase B (glutamine-hydrolysing)
MSAPPVALPAPYRPTRLEVACGVLFEIDTAAAPLPRLSRFRTAREALEHAVMAGLQRPPCAVSFSGGRDSSAVLAIATHVARREGLPLPIPVTLRFPLCVEADETVWQESVISHLGLDDWRRLEFTDEIDILGPYAQRVLRHHGPLWPFNSHFHAPIADEVSGGSVLTGFGGDELLTSWPKRRVAMIVARQTRPHARDIGSVAASLAPSAIRRRVLARASARVEPLPWLQPRSRSDLVRARARAAAMEPIRWDESVRRHWWRSRYRSVACDSLSRVIADAGGATAFHPLCDKEFLIAIAAERSQLGFRNRTVAMESLFGDLLPPSLLSRTSKGLFNTAAWQRHARDFVAQWDGSGVDESIIDIDALRAVWSDERPDPRSFSLLHGAWLAQNGRSAS